MPTTRTKIQQALSTSIKEKCKRSTTNHTQNRLNKLRFSFVSFGLNYLHLKERKVSKIHSFAAFVYYLIRSFLYHCDSTWSQSFSISWLLLVFFLLCLVVWWHSRIYMQINKKIHFCVLIFRKFRDGYGFFFFFSSSFVLILVSQSWFSSVSVRCLCARERIECAYVWRSLSYICIPLEQCNFFFCFVRTTAAAASELCVLFYFLLCLWQIGNNHPKFKVYKSLISK